MSTHQQLTSTTAPGKVFHSRAELAEHYKSDWHKYNLKRREAGLPLLGEQDFTARLEAALALKREREGREERSGTDHLKNGSQIRKKRDKKKNDQQQQLGDATAVSQVAAYDRIKNQPKQSSDKQKVEDGITMEEDGVEEDVNMMKEEDSPVVEPRQCLFDKHMSPSLEANVERMQRKYGFFVPDQEYLVDKEGLVGYCHEKIKLGHVCLYCQRVFSTYTGCQKHMISTRHTKIRYERGIDLEEFDPFYDFSEADAEFLGHEAKNKQEEVLQDVVNDDGEAEWEDVSDDEDEEMLEPTQEEDEDEGLYADYQDEIARFGFNVTPLGELVFPDGRIVGHRGLARYYKQRIPTSGESTAVVSARRAASERLYRGRVYTVGEEGETSQSSALVLARAGINPATAGGRAGKGVLVPAAGGYTALSLYRYKAVIRKARRDNARGQRLEHKTTININRMDKKANRLMNNVSVAHAQR
jgi:pre-60S factor REI1